jgi:Protein of unknown function (DUF3105)
MACRSTRAARSRVAVAALATFAALGCDDEPGGRGLRDATSDDDGGSAAICTRCDACEESVSIDSAAHVVGPVHYPSRPPAGGDHNACWTQFGVLEEPSAAERWVHTLEHGAVAVLYDCPSGCADEVADLAAFARDRSWALVTSYPDMPTRFAIVAWGHRLKSDCLDLAAFADFYDAHANRAPESISSGPPEGCPD